jgi:hypothetical protein
MLLETLAAAIQASPLSATLRSSLWLYPLVNTGHVVGIALLFGAIVPLDLRLVGWWQRMPVDDLAGILVPVSVAGLLLALSTGSLLFATRPLDYVGEPLFGIKMALLVLAVGNALLLRLSLPRGSGQAGAGARPRFAWRLAGIVSLVLWLGVITAGRLIGYR